MSAKSHGMSGTRLHNIWKNMKGRCYRESSTHFHRYGGRGICVCNEWLSFEPFMSWSLGNGYNDSLTIDRIDEDGNYEPSNCQWITSSENTSKANKKNIANRTGCQDPLVHAKRVLAFKDKYGVSCELLLSGKVIGKYESLGDAARHISGLTGRKFKSTYSHIKQLFSGKGKCKTISNHTLRVLK